MFVKLGFIPCSFGSHSFKACDPTHTQSSQTHTHAGKGMDPVYDGMNSQQRKEEKMRNARAMLVTWSHDNDLIAACLLI